MRLSSLLVVSCLVSGALPAASQALASLDFPQERLAANLRDEYRDQLLTLRSFLAGKELEFDAEGKPVGSAEPGPWTTWGLLQVRSLKVCGKKLRIEAQRVFLTYDPAQKRFVSVLKLEGLLAAWPSQTGESGNLRQKELRDLGKTRIAIRLAEVSEKGIRTALRKVFLGPDELLEDAVPAYWRSFLRGERAHESLSFLPVGVTEPDREVLLPKPISAANPPYSQVAQSSDFKGKLRLWVVVQSDGTPGEIGIERPAGLGLDENAISTIRNWRFEPGQKDGKAVPVLVSVEVGFRPQ
jgi:TonB family protein